MTVSSNKVTVSDQVQASQRVSQVPCRKLADRKWSLIWAI